MKLPYREMFSSVIGKPGRRQVGTALSGECISAFTKWQPMPMRDRPTEEVRKLPQAEELQLEYGTSVVQPGGHTICTQTV